MQKCLSNLKAGYIFLILLIFFTIFVSITKRKDTDSVTVDPNRTHYSYFSLLNGTLTLTLEQKNKVFPIGLFTMSYLLTYFGLGISW